LPEGPAQHVWRNLRSCASAADAPRADVTNALRQLGIMVFKADIHTTRVPGKPLQEVHRFLLTDANGQPIDDPILRDRVVKKVCLCFFGGGCCCVRRRLTRLTRGGTHHGDCTGESIAFGVNLCGAFFLLHHKDRRTMFERLLLLLFLLLLLVVVMLVVVLVLVLVLVLVVVVLLFFSSSSSYSYLLT